MATDGVKIIEGDLAYDIYGHFMDMYHKGTDIQTLKERFTDYKEDCSFDKFDYEICVTAYALAFWEIGELTEEMLNEVKTVIAEKATVTYWTNHMGERAGNERQKELDKLLKKISLSNPKPKKREKYIEQIDLFNQGDVLSFQYPDKTYGVAFVAFIDKSTRFHGYSLCRTTYKSELQPTISDFVQNATFYAGEVPSSNGMALLAWCNELEHRDFSKFASSFSKIGRIQFQLETGQSIITTDFQVFCDNSRLESEISYTKKIGMQVEEYPISKFIKIIEY